MKSLLQILIVDDDSNFSQECSRQIKESGITTFVKTALNGGHALLSLNQIYSNLKDKKLLILLDTNMPIMDGIEFLQNFEKCEYPHKDNILIVMMVEKETKKEHIELAKQMGIKHYIDKPVCPSRIGTILTEENYLEQVA